MEHLAGTACRADWRLPAHPPDEIERAKHVFDPNVLTIGFARRFATYKRPNLLLHDPDRLLRILHQIRSVPFNSFLPAKRIRRDGGTSYDSRNGSNSFGGPRFGRTSSS